MYNYRESGGFCQPTKRKSDAQIYRDARLFSCIRRADSYLPPAERLRAALERRTRWLYERDADGKLVRYKTIMDAAADGEILLQTPAGERLAITYDNIELLDREGYRLCANE